MYEFTDTAENKENNPLGTESFKLNGIYLENVVPGYRTLYVCGRELAECEVDDYQIGKRNGTKYRSKRYSPRTITIGYQILSKSALAFREAYNKLNQLLDAEQAKLIFDDEPDKYFIATKTGNTQVEPGLNCVIGEIEFYCTDPFKYSVAEKVFTASQNPQTGILETVIVNKGATAVPISYEITHKHENGFIGITSQYGALQYGDIQEMDMEERKKSEVLLNYKSGKDISGMQVGKGIITYPSDLKTGTFKTATYWGGAAGNISYLTVDNIGNGSNWHGPSGLINIPAGSDGKSGSKNFKLQARLIWELMLYHQTGVIQINVGDEDGKLLASMNLYKWTREQNTATYRMHLGENAEIKKELFFAPVPAGYSFEGSAFSTAKAGGYVYVQKSGELFEFYFDGKKYQYRAPELAEKKAASITIWIGQWGNNGSGNLMRYMGVQELFFRSDSVSYIYDIPNRYKDGDVISVDGEHTKMYVNGIPSMEDEITGSKYFLAPPGETTVQFSVSDFCAPKPSVTARIREAYL